VVGRGRHGGHARAAASRRTGDRVAETTWRGKHTGPFLGVEPTGRSIEVPVILVAELRDGLMGGERIYWDRATVLEQLARPVS
jgi:predicted ester cyclase